MKLKSIIYVCLFAFVLVSCGPKKEKPLPPVPESFIVQMFNSVDHIDYYFRNTNFSVSQDTKEAVQQFISLLSPTPAVNPSKSCVSPLRMTFLSEGNIAFETEMYMSEGCMYVEYIVDGKPTYQTSHSEQGYNFLQNIIKSATNGR